MGAGYGLQGYQHIEYARYLDEFVIGIAADDDGQLAQRVFEAVQVRRLIFLLFFTQASTHDTVRHPLLHL
jgi:hypothetical protein